MSLCAFCVLLVPFVVLLTEGVERAAGSDVDSSVGDRGCRVAFVVELVDGENLPVARGFQDRHLTTLTDQKHFVVSGNRRREILIDRAVQTSLFEYVAGYRIKRDQNAAVVNHVEHVLVKQR